MDTSTMIGGLEAAWSKAPPFLFTALALVAGLLTYFYTPYWRLRKLPGPPANLLVGHLPLIIKYGLDMCTILAKEYGPVFKIRMGRQPIVVVTDPELCREVMIKNFKDFPNRSLPAVATTSPFLGKSLFTSKYIQRCKVGCNEEQRGVILPTLLSGKPHPHDAILHRVGYSLRLAAKEDEDINFTKILYKLFTEILGRSAFGVKFGLLTREGEATDKEDEMARAFLEAHKFTHSYALKMDLKSAFSTVLGFLIPILEIPTREVLRRLPWTADYRVYRANMVVAEKVNDIVTKRGKELERGTMDFISVVLRARDSDGPKRELFTPDYVSSLAYEHILAGTSSTAFGVSTVLYLVSKHPEVEKKLLQEIDGFGPHEVVPNADDLQKKFPYLDQVISESQRYYSNCPMTARKASKPVEVGGYVVPKGTWVWLALDFLAKDPRNFPEPEAFRPERFDPDCEEQKRRHPYALLPFGCGPRSCIGKKFALQEMKLCIIHLYRRFTFAHSPNMESPVEFEYGGILVGFKHGLKLRVKRRSALQ